MTRSETISPGVHIATFEDGAAVYDTMTETLHLVDLLTLAILTPDAVSTDRIGRGPDPPDETPAESGAPQPELVRPGPHQVLSEADLSALLDRRRSDLVTAGLIGRTIEAPTTEPVTLPKNRARPGDLIGETHVIFDLHYAFTGTNSDLIESIDETLNAPVSVAPDTLFRIIDSADGTIDLQTDTHWRFPNRQAFLAQLPTVLNRIASRSDRHPVLHAGGVRTPDGRVLLVTGPSRAGKSTLVAHLIRHGCDLLSDESIAIRRDLHALPHPKPLSLRAGSLASLGFDPIEPGNHPPNRLRADVRSITAATGPIDSVFAVDYDPTRTMGAEIDRLDARAAIPTVITNCLNLKRSGSSGLQTLTDLATRTPVFYATHSDSERLAELLLTNDPGLPTHRANEPMTSPVFPESGRVEHDPD